MTHESTDDFLKIVNLDGDAQGFDDMCKCGHPLKHHSFTRDSYGLHGGVCVFCECPSFNNENKSGEVFK